MARLEAGDKAPPFTLTDQDEKPVSLKDFKGAPVVVYFYPADDTPGCTKEACQFNDNLRAFDRAGVKVVGISPTARPSTPASARSTASSSPCCRTSGTR